MKNHNSNPHREDCTRSGSCKALSNTRNQIWAGLLGVLIGVSGTSQPAWANPEGGQVVAGGAVISQPDATTVQINQSTDKAVIDWRSFNIGAAEQTRFNQPSSSSIALNRIDPGQGASTIAGRLSANGQIWLVNPAGIFFTSTARVDAAGILATTANILTNDFMNGNYYFVQSPDWNGSVVHAGTMTIADSGLAMLVAPAVVNTGVIQANMGKVVLAAGNEFTVDFYGDQLINFGVNAKVTKNPVDAQGNSIKSGVTHSGEIYANGGKVLLTAQTAKSVVDNAINMDGYVEAKAAVQRGGSIILMGGDEGVVRVAGKMDASGKLYAQKGGKVQVTGKRVALVDNASIDVSGDHGGGEVLVGGDYQGKNSAIQNAEQTFVGSHALINADAVTQGTGGKVIVWADDATFFSGNVFARGGAFGGDGGFVEVSGKNNLGFHGYVNLDARVAQNRGGTLLLDPNDLCISVGIPTGCGGAGSIQLNSNPFEATGGSDYYVLSSTLQALSAGTSPILQATNNIIFETSLVLLTGSGSTFSATAGNEIRMVSFGITTAGGAVTLTAGAGGITNMGAINTAGGVLTVNSPGAISQTGVISGTGTSLVKQGSGTFTLTSTNTYTGGTTVSGGTLLTASALGNSGANGPIGTGSLTIENGGIFSYTGATATSNRPISIGTGGGTLQTNRTGTASTLTLSGGINIGANTLTIDTSGTGPGNITITTNPITGAATGSSLIKTGVNTLTISIASTYGSTSSTTTINDGTLTTTVANGLPVTTALTVGGSGTFNMNQVQTIASLTGSGLIRNSAATNRILTVGDSTSTTFSGTLGNTGGLTIGLTKQGSGTLTLSGTSVYTGATSVSAGTLKAGSTTAFSNSSAFTVTSTLDLNSFAQEMGSLAGAGEVLLSANLTTGGNNSNTTFSGLLNGSHSFIKKGTGTQTLSGTVSGYTGTTNINEGGVTVTTNANAIGTGTVNISPTGATSSTFTITNLDITNNINLNSTNAAATLSATGTRALSGLIGLTGTNNTFTTSGTTTMANTVSGSGSIIKAGSGTWALTGSNIYTGKTTINAGTLSVNSIGNVNGGSSALGAPTTALNGTIDLGAGTLTYTGSGHSSDRVINLTGAGTITASGTGALNLSGGVTGTDQNLTLSGTATGANASILSGAITTGTGTLTKTAAGTWILSGNNTNSGTTTITTGTLQIGNGGTSGALGGGDIVDNATLIFNRSDALTVNNNISGTGALTQAGAGVLTFGGNNTYSGTTTVSAGTTLKAGAANTLSANSAISLGNAANTILDLSSIDNMTVRSLAGGSGGGEVRLGSGTLTIQNAVNNNNTNFSGVISGAGNITINLTGTGTPLQEFSGANTYSGLTTVTQGSLRISNVTGLGSAAQGTVVNNGGRLDLDAISMVNGEAITLNGSGIGGTGALINTGASSTNSNITLASDSTIGGTSNTLTLSGVISGGFNVTKVGAGTLVLSGANTYTGKTTISAGTLSVNSISNVNGGNSALGAPTTALNGTIDLGAATLTYTGAGHSSDRVINLTGAGTITASGTGALTLSGGVTGTDQNLTLSGTATGANASFLSGVINTGSGTVTKSGTGTWTLSGLNTYTGVTAITAGTLSINSLGDANGTASALGAPTTSVDGTIALGAATLLYTGSGHSSNRIINLSGAGSVDASGSGTLDLSGGVTGSNQNMILTGSGTGKESGVINTGSGTVTKSSTGTWILEGANSYTGATTVNGGTLEVTHALGLGTSATGTTINSTGTLKINNVTVASEAITLNDGGTLLGVGTAAVLGSTSNITLAGTLATNRSITTASGTDHFTLNGTINGAGALTLSGPGTLQINNAIGNTTALRSITSSGSGTVVLNGGSVVTGSSGSQTYNSIVSLAQNTLFTVGNNQSIQLLNTSNNFTAIPTFASTGTLTTVSLVNASSSPSLPVFNTTPTNLSLNFVNSGIALPAYTLGGTLSVTAGGNITQSGALVITGVATFASGSNHITLNDINNNFSTVSITSGNNVSLTDSNALILGASTVSGMLNVTTQAGSITDSGNLSLAQLATFSAGGSTSDVTLDSAGNDFNSVAISTARNVTLIDANAIDLAASTASGTLSVTSGGAITDSGILSITGTTTLAAGSSNDITLDNANNFSTVGITTGRNVTLVDVNAINFAASTVSGTWNVSSGGAITDTGALSIAGSAVLAAGSGNDITLNTASNNFNTIGIVSGNNVTLVDANAIDLSASTVSGTLNITSNGAITDSGALVITEAATWAAGSGNNITLDSASNNFSTVGITSGNNVALVDADAIDLAASTVSGTLNVTASGNITQSGVLTVTGAPTFTISGINNKDIILDTAANNFQTTPVITNNGNVSNLAIRNINASASVPLIPAGLTNLTLIFNNNAMTLPALTISGTLTVTAGNTLTQSGALSASALIAKTLNNAGAAITLDNSSNNIANVSLQARNAADSANDSGAITYVSAANINMTQVGTTSSFTLTANGNITDSGAVVVTGLTTLASGSSNDITLDTASNNFGTLSIVSGKNVSIVDTNGIIFGDSVVSDALNVTTGGGITSTGALQVGGVATLNATAGNVTLNSALNDFHTVIVNGATDLTLVDANAMILGNVTLRDDITATAGGDLTLSDLITSNAGTGAFSLSSTGGNIVFANNGSIASNGRSVTFNAPVLLNADTSITTNGNPIVFNSTINGAKNLTLNAGALGDITLSGNVGSLSRLNTLYVVSMDDLFNNGLINAVSFTQDAGNVTSFGNNGLNVTGAATITGNTVNGAVNVNALSLNVDFANLNGTVNGQTGYAAIALINILNPPLVFGTHFFDGIDMTSSPPVPPTPVPVSNNSLIDSPAAQRNVQYIFPTADAGTQIESSNNNPATLVAGGSTKEQQTQTEETKNGCVGIGGGIEICSSRH